MLKGIHLFLFIGFTFFFFFKPYGPYVPIPPFLFSLHLFSQEWQLITMECNSRFRPVTKQKDEVSSVFTDIYLVKIKNT